MRIRICAAIVPLLAATAAHAISLAPGQTATPDLLVFMGPNEIDPAPGGNATLLPYPVNPPSGYYSFGLSQNTLTGATTYDLHVTVNQSIPLTSVSLKGYQGVSVDAGVATGSTFLPTSVSRSADGDVITYFFTTLPVNQPNGVAPSTDFIIRTDATEFDEYFQSGTLTFVDSALPGGSFSTNLNAFAPAPTATTAPVPELSSLSLLILATAGFALRFRRRIA